MNQQTHGERWMLFKVEIPTDDDAFQKILPHQGGSSRTRICSGDFWILSTMGFSFFFMEHHHLRKIF